MKLRKRKAIIASTMILSLNVSANDSFYIVKQGDTLSSILNTLDLNPIYGKHGALAETLRLNLKISSTGGNKIFPMMKIFLVNPSLNDKIITTDNRQQTTDNRQQNIHLTNHETRLGEVATRTPKTIAPEIPANDRIPSDNFKQSFYWEASPSLSWKSLSSTDENVYRSSQIYALSNTNYGVSLAYGMHFEEGIDVYSKLFLESVSFVQDSTINLLKKDFIASRFSMGLSLEKKWQFELAMSDKFFLTSPNLGNVDIKKVTLPEFKTTYIKDFYHYREAKLSYSFSGSAFLPRTSPDVKSKFSYGAGGAVEAKLHNQSFKLGFDIDLLKATGNSTNSKNIYWQYIWETL